MRQQHIVLLSELGRLVKEASIQTGMPLIALKRSLGLVLLVCLGSWALLAMELGWGTSVGVLPDFLISTLYRLGHLPALVPSLLIVFLSLLLLVFIATFSAWLEVHHPSRLWRHYSLILLFPSFIPVYIYGLSVESAVSVSTAQWLTLGPLCVAVGNGLWWWWHREFVDALRNIHSDRGSVGIANLGMDPLKFFVLPEFRIYVAKRLPEMFLWVAVNALFFEAAAPERSGVLYDLILSLSDGRRAVDWTGVVVAVAFVGFGWVICAVCSEKIARQGVVYRGWLLIRDYVVERLSQSNSLSRETILTVVCFSPVSFALIAVYSSIEGAVEYWELLVLMTGLALVTQFVTLSKRVGSEDRRSEKRKEPSYLLGWALTALLLLAFIYQVNQGDWGFSVVGEQSSVDAGLEEEDLIYIDEETSMGESQLEIVPALLATFGLLGTFALFAGGALIIYLIALVVVFLFSFNAVYSWEGAEGKWFLYKTTTAILQAGSKIPPYLFLVLAVFWLGFQTYGGCTKQFLWGVALFLSLLPTQMLALYSAVDDAAGSRFLTARKAIGNSAWKTFWFLITSHWSRIIPALLTFALGLVVLMDMSMIWLLDDRGTFTCHADHWLDGLRNESLPSFAATLIWLFYPAVIYLCVYKRTRRGFNPVEVGTTG